MTRTFAAKFRDPKMADGKKNKPQYILGEMVYDVDKNSYRTVIEYEDGSEDAFDIPSVRGKKASDEGMKPITNNDGLMEYQEA